MDYLTTVEAAKKWNISSRMAAYYGEAGRVKGAVKKGKSWLVPVSAEKPVDKRHFKKTVKHKDDRKRKGNGDLFTADHGGGDQASAICNLPYQRRIPASGIYQGNSALL